MLYCLSFSVTLGRVGCPLLTHPHFLSDRWSEADDDDVCNISGRREKKVDDDDVDDDVHPPSITTSTVCILSRAHSRFVYVGAGQVHDLMNFFFFYYYYYLYYYYHFYEVPCTFLLLLS